MPRDIKGRAKRPMDKPIESGKRKAVVRSISLPAEFNDEIEAYLQTRKDVRGLSDLALRAIADFINKD